MASFPLNLEKVGIIVWARFLGPSGKPHDAKLVLDTGTANTVLSEQMALGAGYSEDMAAGVAYFQTLTGEEEGYTVRVPRFTAMGIDVSNYLAACQPVHPNLDIDGLLGLDFFRDRDLLLGFASPRLRVD